MEVRKLKSQGFTLVEAMVALVILVILLLGLLQSLIVYYDVSTRNLLRNEAIRIAYEYADKFRNMPLSSIPASDTYTENRQVRNSQVTYSIKTTSVSKTGGKIKEITIEVSWSYRGKQFYHIIKTLVGEDE